jgi:SAM-dependent methyltransferase
MTTTTTVMIATTGRPQQQRWLSSAVTEAAPRLAVSVARALRPGGRFVFVTAEAVSPLDPRALQARAFNALMRVRNAVWDPPFVMYYLTFLVPRAREVLEAAGLRVRVLPGALPASLHPLVVVVAEKPDEPAQSA